MAIAGNLVSPSILREVIPAEIAAQFLLYRTGVASLDMPNQILGAHYQFRKWSQITGVSVINDGSATDASVSTFAMTQQIAPVIKRFKVASFTDAEATQAAEMTVDEFTTQIAAPQFANFWVAEFHRLLIAQLTGLFDASAGVLKTTNMVSVTTPINVSTVLKGKAKLGERQLDLGAMFVHSDVFHDMQLEARVEWLDQIGAVRLQKAIRVYEGMAVYLDDSLATSGSGATKTYDTLMLAPKSVQFAIARDFRTFQLEAVNPPSRSVSQAADIVAHVPGTKYVAATLPPTDAALVAAVSWEKPETDARNIRVVCLRTYSSLNS
jgi:hypothetical protein